MLQLKQGIVVGFAASLLTVQSCISAEDPKLPPPSSHPGATGGYVSSQGGEASGTGGAAETGGEATSSEPTETGGEHTTGGAKAIAGGARATGGAKPLAGGARATGGAKAAVGGERASGGAQAMAGGARATGGAKAMAGGALSTGGARLRAGGAESVGGVGPANTGGGANSGGCDFTSASCPVPCDAYAATSATAWKQAPCQALIDCLQTKASCISAADPLCGPKQSPSYAAPVCGDAYYGAASDSDISTAVTTYIKCVCGF